MYPKAIMCEADSADTTAESRCNYPGPKEV